jgi:methylenetetrahydrofolate reductase (NADPH)
MSNATSSLQDRIASGKPLLVAELSPPHGADAAAVRQAAKRHAGKVHALGISDNRERVAMSALAAASIVAGEGIEPILHVTTRDRNRIALVSEALGAQALGIRNLLCTSGTHQTLGQFRAAKNVYDLDSVQLLQTYSRLAADGSAVGEGSLAGAGPFCLGGVASPDADPLELQIPRLAKKAQAGAAFLITQPIYDMGRLDVWWAEVTRRGIHEKVAILAGVQPLCGVSFQLASEARSSGKRQPFRIPDDIFNRIASKSGAAAQRAAAVELALETIQKLSGFKGLRGFEISGDGEPDVALEIIEKSGLGSK